MPFIKRHRSGEEMPRLTHPQPDERAAPLCQDLVKHPSVQAAILGGSRHTGAGTNSRTWMSLSSWKRLTIRKRCGKQPAPRWPE